MTRKKKALDLTARRYQTALASQVYGIVMVAEDSRVEFANQTFCDMFGLSTDPADLVGLTSAELLELVGPAYADPAATLARVRDVLAAGRHYAGDEVRMRDGRVLLVDFSPIVVDGKPSGRMWQHRDITERKGAEEALERSEEQVRLLLNSTAEAIYGIDLEGNCTFANPSCLAMLGYADTEQLLGKNMHRLIHHSYPDGRPMPVEVCRIYRAFREGKGVHVDDEVLWRADGTSFPVEYRSYPQVAGGEVTGAVVTFSDITERKHAQELLAAERQRLAYILEGTNVGTWEWNVQTGEAVFNERWAEIIGYTLAELAPVSIETWTKFAHPDDLQVSSDLLEKHFRKELPYYECETRMHHKDGSWVWVLDRGKVATWTEDGKPLAMSGTHQDITTRKRAEGEVLHLATHDALTDLPSLRLAMDRLAMAFGQARRHRTAAAVMFIDLDGFKAVNDTLGHDAGDRVLKQVAQRMLFCLRETDTVARVGGDEFLVIAAELNGSADAARIAEKVIRAVSQPVITGRGQQAVVGASIGIALYPDNSEDVDQLIKLADEAMYRIKNSGKNGFVFADTAKR
jgi:diguanylate cyclase (GGDEF)-like protein/PAS domain S-box-containing protein